MPLTGPYGDDVIFGGSGSNPSVQEEIARLHELVFSAAGGLPVPGSEN